MRSLYKQILLVEDNERNRKKIRRLLSGIQGITILEAESSEKAYKYAIEYNINLFIIDIILNTSVNGDVSGIQFAEQMRKLEKYEFVPMIFTTALEDAGLYAYAHLHCYRYFEKPYDEEEFYQTVLSALKYKTIEDKKEFYYYKKDGVIYTLRTKNIMYIENKKVNVLIHCHDRSIITTPYKSCKQILLELHSDRFLKCNKSTIVNVEYIARVDTVNRRITLVNQEETLELGQRLKGRFLEGFLHYTETEHTIP